MAQSLSKVIVHIIFSTKDREPWLGSEVRPRMHAYLATVWRDIGAELVRVGGVADHVHIVTLLPRTVSQAQLIEEIRKRPRNGSKRLTLAIAVFSRTFQEEYRELLRRHRVDFDEQYVWD